MSSGNRSNEFIYFYISGKPKWYTLSSDERQLARKQHLKEYCVKHTFNKNPSPEDLRYLAVDDELKIIICVTPKVATKTLKSVIALSRGITDQKFNRWDIWKRWDSYTEEERSQRLKTYFKFVFVREPLQRLLSAYKDRLIKHSHEYKLVQEEIVRALRPQDFNTQGNNFVSFPEFIQYYSDNKTRDQHWRQYEKLCHPCVINYDFIGHLETMEEDAALLLKMVRIDDRVTFPPIQNSTGLSEVVQYYSQVPSQYITLIGEQYRSDFEMFGYKYLGQVKEILEQSNKTSPLFQHA